MDDSYIFYVHYTCMHIRRHVRSTELACCYRYVESRFMIAISGNCDKKLQPEQPNKHSEKHLTLDPSWSIESFRDSALLASLLQ